MHPLGPREGLILAATASALRDVARSAQESVYLCAHVGDSMNPTLHESDLLEIARYQGQPPRPGDVVLFVVDKEELAVVHRVVGITPLGVRTRGDNNDLIDPWTVHPEDILGRVVAASRGDHRRSIPGGRGGLLRAQAVRALRVPERALARLLSPLYRRLAASGILRSVAPPSLHPRVVIFQAGDQRRFRLMIGRHTIIGHYDPTRHHWHIRRPFRLLVDEASLPTFP